MQDLLIYTIAITHTLAWHELMLRAIFRVFGHEGEMAACQYSLLVTGPRPTHATYPVTEGMYQWPGFCDRPVCCCLQGPSFAYRGGKCS